MFAAFQEKQDGLRADPADNIYKDGLDLCFTIKLRNLENEMKDLLRQSNNPHAMASIHTQVTAGRTKEELRALILNEDFIKTVEFEYAVSYLKRMKIEPSDKNIASILKKHPLSGCNIRTSGWDNTT